MMPITFDAAATGNTASGPASDDLTVTWTHTAGSDPGVAVVAFSFDTTAPNLRSITHTVTYDGDPMTLLKQEGKGWGLPKSGYVELWGTDAPVVGAKTISVGLVYEQDENDPWSPASATFSNFRGSSVSYDGATGFGRAWGHSSASKVISVGVSAYQNSTTVGAIGSDGSMSGAILHETLRFADAGSRRLVIGEIHGPGSARLQGTGAPWAAVAVNLLPV